MTKHFPQHAKTNHPDVIAAIEATLSKERAFHEEARIISEKYTGDPFKGWMSGSTFRGMNLSQIEVTEEQYEELPGKWKKRDYIGRTSPYSNNKKAEGFHVSYEPEAIPGRGNILMGDGYMGSGTVFIHEGYVYSYFGFLPSISDKSFDEIEKYDWEEIKGSELHKAIEDYNDALKEKKDD